MEIILYHDNCPDGFTSAWAAWKKFGDAAAYKAMNYSDPIPSMIDGHDVYLVDFSFPLPLMKQLAQRAASVTVFDHHKTAKEALAQVSVGRVVFDMDRSGAGITWDELHPSTENWLGIRPRLVSYIEDRDLWRWELLSSREVSEYIFATPRTFRDWDMLAERVENGLEKVIEGGQILLQAKRIRVATTCANVRLMNFNGITLPIVNAAWDMSEIGEYLCEQFPQC